jgi:uncharacterized oligopeptide transporter (OPT) family protein
VIAVPLAMVMGFVAARVTGETDITPTKALGPVTQLVYGVITGLIAGESLVGVLIALLIVAGILQK